MTAQAWTIICRTTHVHEARLIESVLNGSGFETRLRDHETIGMNSFYSNAIGGVKVEVRSNATEEATAVLKKFADAQDLNIEWTVPEVQSDSHEETIRGILRRMLFSR